MSKALQNTVMLLYSFTGSSLSAAAVLNLIYSLRHLTHSSQILQGWAKCEILPQFLTSLIFALPSCRNEARHLFEM